jgi:putative ABC transport system ATP-binding protein
MNASTPPHAVPPRPGDPASNEPLVQVRDLRLTVPAAAGPVNILNGVDLEMVAGEAVGLVGPSGSGKTSLLMLLAGLERATGGAIRVAGSDLTALDEDALARFRRQTIGIVFQAFHLIPTMTALENVAVPLELAGDAQAGRRAEAALRAVGLGHRLRHLPGQLSGGEQQRVALARAYAPRPRLLLADEPTGNLDHATGAAVMDLLFELRERHGTTLLLITHDHVLAARCGRQVHMEDGRITDPASARAVA